MFVLRCTRTRRPYCWWTLAAEFLNRRRRLGSAVGGAARPMFVSARALQERWLRRVGRWSCDQVDEMSVVNPILRDAGVRRLLGVPVYGPDGLLGVLHIGSLSERSFGDADVARMEELSAGIGQRLSEQRENDVHIAALVLQRSLLPAAPPSIEGLDLAVRYLPAEGDLGGDWYDIFVLPSGKVGLVMGDVEGHGLRSAVVMGRLRSALRAYALEHEDPAEVLCRLDRKLCHFESGITATVIYAVTEPPFDTLLICTAGHPPPLSRRQRPARGAGGTGPGGPDTWCRPRPTPPEPRALP